MIHRVIKSVWHRLEGFTERAVTTLKLTQGLHVDFTNHTIVGNTALNAQHVGNRPTLPSTQSQFSGLFSSALPYRRIIHGITG